MHWPSAALTGHRENSFCLRTNPPDERRRKEHTKHSRQSNKLPFHQLWQFFQHPAWRWLAIHIKSNLMVIQWAPCCTLTKMTDSHGTWKVIHSSSKKWALLCVVMLLYWKKRLFSLCELYGGLFHPDLCPGASAISPGSLREHKLKGQCISRCYSLSLKHRGSQE